MTRLGQNHKQPERFELILLGTGTCVPDVNHGAPGFIVRNDSQTVLLDGGSGTLHRMAAAGVDFRDLDAICLSHFHPDHCADLVPLLFATRYTPEFTRSKILTIIGPAGLRKFWDKLANLYGDFIKKPTFPLRLIEAESNHIKLDRLTVFTAPVQHSGKTIAFRLENADGCSLTYSGDTGYCQSLIALANQTDLLLIECSFPDARRMDIHLTPTEVGRVAATCNCQQVILIHLYPIFATEEAIEQVKRFYPGNVTAGRDFMTFQINKKSTADELKQ